MVSERRQKPDDSETLDVSIKSKATVEFDRHDHRAFRDWLGVSEIERCVREQAAEIVRLQREVTALGGEPPVRR